MTVRSGAVPRARLAVDGRSVVDAGRRPEEHGKRTVITAETMPIGTDIDVQHRQAVNSRKIALSRIITFPSLIDAVPDLELDDLRDRGSARS